MSGTQRGGSIRYNIYCNPVIGTIFIEMFSAILCFYGGGNRFEMFNAMVKRFVNVLSQYKIRKILHLSSCQSTLHPHAPQLKFVELMNLFAREY